MANRLLKGYDVSAQSLWEWQYDDTERGEPGKRWLSPTLTAREMNRFIGREKILNDIVAWLKADKKPLLVLEGFGGNGKTRLAVEAVLRIGGAFDGGVVFLPLEESFSGPSENSTRRALSEVFARAIDGTGELPQAVQRAPSDADAEKLLHDFLNSRVQSKEGELQILLVLDNWESVANAQTNAWVEDLLRQVPRLRCLITTRTAVGVSTLVQTLPIDGLPSPKIGETDVTGYDSYQLFVERAQQRAPLASFSDTPSLVRILRAVEGSPLGIELTAAQVLRYPVLSEIADGLEESKRGLLEWQRTRKELGDVRRDAARHASIWACVDWSVKLMPEAEQILFLRLSLFPFDFGPETAPKAVGGAETQLMRWKDAGLLRFANTTTTRRYTLSPPVRQYANDCLAELGETYQVAAEEHFVNYWAAWMVDNHFEQRDAAGNIRFELPGLNKEWRNVIAAHQIALVRRMRAALGSLAKIADFVFAIQSRWKESQTIYAGTCSVAHSEGWQKEEADAWNGLGRTHTMRGEQEEAYRAFRNSLRIYRDTGDQAGEAISLHGFAEAKKPQNNFRRRKKLSKQVSI